MTLKYRLCVLVSLMLGSSPLAAIAQPMMDSDSGMGVAGTTAGIGGGGGMAGMPAAGGGGGMSAGVGTAGGGGMMAACGAPDFMQCSDAAQGHGAMIAFEVNATGGLALEDIDQLRITVTIEGVPTSWSPWLVSAQMTSDDEELGTGGIQTCLDSYGQATAIVEGLSGDVIVGEATVMFFAADCAEVTTQVTLAPPGSCGNGTLEGVEQCEPPGRAGCDATCQATCGNRVIDPDEDCEPPNTASCDSQCRLPGEAAGASTDAHVPDADAGMPVDSPIEAGGCACVAVGNRRSSSWGLWALAALAFVAAQRRRAGGLRG